MQSRLIKGDCLIENKQIKDGEVDLICWDLPYGTVKGMGLDGWNNGIKTEWDMAIPPKDVFSISNRILRKNGKLVLFSQEPYTSLLISEAIANLPFSYRMMWLKDHYANCLLAKKAPVSYYEDILVFSKKHDLEALHPLRDYSLRLRAFTNYSRKRFTEKLGHGGHQHFMEGNKESSQFALCTEETYNQLIKEFGIDKMEGFKSYSELAKINSTFNSTFNLWQGKKYKSNVLAYKKDYDGYHPTQKPVLLLEDLIKTFSNKGDLVVDLTMGSGSCGVAARNTDRRFIGIERDDNYFDIADMRINKTLKPPKRIVDEKGRYQTSIFDIIGI